MGNTSSHAPQNQINGSVRPQKNDNIRDKREYPSRVAQSVKVLPDLESRLKLRHTNNGEILHSGGTLSGRQDPFRNTSLKQYSFNEDRRPVPKRNDQSSQNKQFAFQFKQYNSEPDLRISNSRDHAIKEYRCKKKYRAPPPPTGKKELKSFNRDEENMEESPLRRIRLFKTRAETKKESSQIGVNDVAINQHELVCLEEKIRPTENAGRPKFQSRNLNIEDETPNLPAEKSNSQLLSRDEPSGKESSIPELSPDMKNDKLKSFYFGMENEDSDISSCQAEDDEDQLAIALNLRPVLPRKRLEIGHFSPIAAWRQLDSRLENLDDSEDLTVWTPPQVLNVGSSMENLNLTSFSKHRAHIFSLSLPRDLQPPPPPAVTSNKISLNGFRTLKRSVSGMLNTLSLRKNTKQRPLSKDMENNWFLIRSAPNSINESSLDMTDMFSHNTPRLMYLPEKEFDFPDLKFSKSCEDLQGPHTNNLDIKIENKGGKSQSKKKFTFQSTIRQIERKKIAEKLSKEAELKEKQRLREIEVIKRVEEEFQRKRDKEKANIRHQLRLYAMEEEQWTSLPFESDHKLEERQEPDGAISSHTSSPVFIKKHSEPKIITQATQELSEYRQAQRNYKDYRGFQKALESRYLKETVHKEVTCNMPNAQEYGYGHGNYRKDFANGAKKSISSLHSEESPKTYRNVFSSVSKF
ncbi:hypothetical protein ABEB36_010951 [Hypothenemus hampei]|uniref:Uncharacterized protein n=1 Tax=Hypothenemus hampei TaxID=57062 RepID=A0ABD1EDL7_HYPHA